MYEQLAADLKSSDKGVRFYAAQRLGTLDDPRTAASLIQALPDENSKVQYAALSSLIKLGAREALDAILTMLLTDLKSRVWDLLKLGIGMRLRTGLIEMVERGDTALSDRLVAALENHELDEHQRALFLRMLGRTADPRRVELLINTLTSDAPALRVSAAEALGWMGDARAVPTLLISLEHEDDSIRETSAEALGRIGDAQAFDAVVVALGDENEWVRRASAEALGAFGDARAIEPLTAALSDEVEMVQDAAFDSLKKLSTDHFTTTF